MHPSLRRAGTPLRAALTGLAALTALAVAVPAQAASAPLSAYDQAVHDRLTLRSLASRLGPDLAGVVLDAETGQVIWKRTPQERQIPASNAKLLTAVTALSVFGPEHRFTTTVTTGATPGRVVLVGSGDPSLSSGNLRNLARQTVAAVLAAGVTRVRVDVDDTLLPAPTLAVGWKPDYLVRDVSPVRALVVDGHRRWDTSLDAGRAFAALLERRGLDVSVVRRSARPAEATTLATVQGRPLSEIVTIMLKDSDNDIAELLHRMVAVQTGFPATWAGAADAAVARLAELGVAVTPGSVKDGSGLSRAARLRPSEVASVLRLAFHPAHPQLAGLRSGALAVAGVDGTLGPDYRRYVTRPTRCAAGLIEAKTGSLSGVITLSGIARGGDGRVKVFSFLLNRVPSTLTTRRAVDRLATTLTGCW